ncbi:hypothetical protein AGMMS49953_05540 [Endomicrobiia bacterium]|nr:hypothetical protein AGMMS49953_05540 [Endomicrobiia bacterium]
MSRKKIVAKLDKFSENIKRLEDAARKNLQNAKDLFNSVLNETFKNKSAVANDNRQVYKKAHWEVKKLGEACNIELGKTPYRGNVSFWDKDKNTKNVWLSIADLLNAQNKVILDSKEYISDEGTNIAKIVKKGTLLLSFKLTLGRLAFAGQRSLYK